ncbi:MAG: hypothetical protein AAF244_04840 [Pseudomonadota bacterium]
MPTQKRNEHALITIYGDNKEHLITQTINEYIPDRDVKILAPECPETLAVAAQNSALVFIGISNENDPHMEISRSLDDDSMVAADVIAFCFEGCKFCGINLLSRGFDCFISQSDTQKPDFKRYLASKLSKGMRRLEGVIQREEFSRLSNALSVAPVSMIIFDADKRAVFVSDHYFRAYPRIAPRLIRGLRVYDAFEMMAEEEGLHQDDERYGDIRNFWHNLSGSVEFTLDDGTSYRLKAFSLPNNTGTLVTGQRRSVYA